MYMYIYIHVVTLVKIFKKTCRCSKVCMSILTRKMQALHGLFQITSGEHLVSIIMYHNSSTVKAYYMYMYV